MLNLNEISAKIGITLYLQNDQIMVDPIFPSLEDAKKAGHEIAAYLPLGTTFEMRYYCATIICTHYYTVMPSPRANRYCPQRKSGNGVQGNKI